MRRLRKQLQCGALTTRVCQKKVSYKTRPLLVCFVTIISKTSQKESDYFNQNWLAAATFWQPYICVISPWISLRMLKTVRSYLIFVKIVIFLGGLRYCSHKTYQKRNVIWDKFFLHTLVLEPSFTRVARDQFNIETATCSDFIRSLFTQQNLVLWTLTIPYQLCSRVVFTFDMLW